jgi:hypothetical protein
MKRKNKKIKYAAAIPNNLAVISHRDGLNASKTRSF